jgi:hypothetical protein
MVWTEFVRLRIGAGGRFLWIRKWNFVFRKILGNSGVTERLLAYEGGLHAVGYVGFAGQGILQSQGVCIYSTTHTQEERRRHPTPKISVFERYKTAHTSEGAATVIGINNIVVKSISKKCLQKFSNEYPWTAALWRLSSRWKYVHLSSTCKATTPPAAVTCSRTDANATGHLYVVRLSLWRTYLDRTDVLLNTTTWI